MRERLRGCTFGLLIDWLVGWSIDGMSGRSPVRYRKCTDINTDEWRTIREDVLCVLRTASECYVLVVLEIECTNHRKLNVILIAMKFR